MVAMDVATGKDIVSFYELWRLVAGYSGNANLTADQNAVEGLSDVLQNGLDYFKKFSATSVQELKKDETIPEQRQCFIIRAAKYMDLDCAQCHNIIKKYISSFFHGSKEAAKKMMEDDRCSKVFLNSVSRFYFNERIYLLRTFSALIANFQDKTHPFQSTLNVVVQRLSSAIPLLQKQLEELQKAKAPTHVTRGPDCEREVTIHFALDQIKEQCEVLQVFVLYFSLFEMPGSALLKFANSFQECGFGLEHTLYRVVPNKQLAPVISHMNTLQQIILIQGFDMDFLQETEARSEHQLVKDKSIFEKLDVIMTSQSNDAHMSPVALAWATVRYLLMDDCGGAVTLKMGEKAVDSEVWGHIQRAMQAPPFNTDSTVAQCAKKTLRGVLSAVTHIFHESTLGDYEQLIAAATTVLGSHRIALTPSKGLADCSLDLLVLSAAGYFPLHCEPILELLTCMADSSQAVLQVHAFVSNMPSYAEYIATCSRDEVESVDGGTCWKLLANKPIRTAGGLHAIKIPQGTIGHFVRRQDARFGGNGMVQWQHQVDGWKIFDAELRCVAKHRGPCGDLRLLDAARKCELVLRLVERVLAAMATGGDKAAEGSVRDTGQMAVLDTVRVHVDAAFAIITRFAHVNEPPLALLTAALRCATAWMRTDPRANCGKVIECLLRIHFLPSPAHHDSVSDNEQLAAGRSLHPSAIGKILTERERMSGSYPVTAATLALLRTYCELMLRYAPDDASDEVSATIEFVLRDVFAHFLDWPRNHLDSWEDIGITCLDLCHVILSAPDRDGGDHVTRRWKKTVVAGLACGAGAGVLVRLSTVPADQLSPLVTEPTSSRGVKLETTARLTFSIFNILLTRRDVIEPPTQLRTLLAASTANGSMVHMLAGYLYHQQSSLLPRLAVTLLCRISPISPMSLHAILGPDVHAFRAILLRRLRGSEGGGDAALKIAIVDLLTMSVQTQPALFELFLDLEEDKSSTAEGGKLVRYRLGGSSVAAEVVRLVSPEREHEMTIDLHTTCVRLMNALWSDRRTPVVKAVQASAPSNFWEILMSPLFSGNSPKDMSQHVMLETCAHVINVVALELFARRSPQAGATEAEDTVNSLSAALDHFDSQKRFQHWSKVMVCVSKSLPTQPFADRRKLLKFISAWKNFVICAGKTSHLRQVDVIATDVITAILVLVDEVEVGDCNKETRTLMELESSLLAVLFAQHPSLLSSDSHLPRIVQCLEKVRDLMGSRFVKFRTDIHSVALRFISTTPAAKVASMNDGDLVLVTCEILHHVFTKNQGNHPPFNHDDIEAAMVSVQILKATFEKADDNFDQCWRSIVQRESVVNLLMSVLVALLTTTFTEHEADNVGLALAISWLLARIASHREGALMIQHTRKLTEYFLALTACYRKDSALKSKWCDVYHVALVTVHRMTERLSHDFIDDALDFVGVHQDRFIECMAALSVGHKPLVGSTTGTIREVAHATALLQHLSRHYVRTWRFKLTGLFERATERIALTSHACVALLLHPRLLLETIKTTKSTTSSQHHLPGVCRGTTSYTSKSSLSEDDSLPPEVEAVQRGLVAVLANCVTFLRNLSPDLCEIALGAATDLDGCPHLLKISFSSPVVGQESLPSFGTIMSAATYALSSSHKAAPSDVAYRDLLNLTADAALTLAMSQCLLLLKDPNVSARSKQILRRELGDEMSCCARSEFRYLRHSSASSLPAKGASLTSSLVTFARRSDDSGSSGRKQQAAVAPSTGGITSPQAGHDGGSGMVDLLTAFVKQVMR